MLGKLVSQKAVPTKQLAKDLKLLAEKELSFKTVLGTTVCADDFFEGWFLFGFHFYSIFISCVQNFLAFSSFRY